MGKKIGLNCTWGTKWLFQSHFIAIVRFIKHDLVPFFLISSKISLSPCLSIMFDHRKLHSSKQHIIKETTFTSIDRMRRLRKFYPILTKCLTKRYGIIIDATKKDILMWFNCGHADRCEENYTIFKFLNQIFTIKTHNSHFHSFYRSISVSSIYILMVCFLLLCDCRLCSFIRFNEIEFN